MVPRTFYGVDAAGLEGGRRMRWRAGGGGGCGGRDGVVVLAVVVVVSLIYLNF